MLLPYHVALAAWLLCRMDLITIQGTLGSHEFSPCQRSLPLLPMPHAAWLASADWQQQLEQLLTVRQPSEEDLIKVGG